MAETTFEVVKDDYIEADWPDSRHKTITLIEGDLADKVRAHYNRSGPVEIHQDGEEGGYSEYTVEWEWHAYLVIDGETVWGDDLFDYSHGEFRSEDDVKAIAERGVWSGPTGLAQHLLAIKEGRA